MLRSFSLDRREGRGKSWRAKMRAQRTRSLKAALALLVALVPAVLLVQALLLGLSVEPVAHGQEVAGKGLLTLLWARLFRMTRSSWHAGLVVGCVRLPLGLTRSGDRPRGAWTEWRAGLVVDHVRLPIGLTRSGDRPRGAWTEWLAGRGRRFPGPYEGFAFIRLILFTRYGLRKGIAFSRLALFTICSLCRGLDVVVVVVSSASSSCTPGVVGRSLFAHPTSLGPSWSLTISTGGSLDSGQAASWSCCVVSPYACRVMSP